MLFNKHPSLLEQQGELSGTRWKALLGKKLVTKRAWQILIAPIFRLAPIALTPPS